MAETEFTIRRKVFTFLGAKFHIYNADGGLLGFCNQKAFKLKEDIRIYTDESMSEERLKIAARQVLDISAAYDVVDSTTDTKVGALQRKGLKSFLRDEWVVFAEDEAEIGNIKEDSTALAILRRFGDMGSWIPQKFHLSDNAGHELAQFRTHFNPFVYRMTVSVFDDCPLNPMLVLAAGVLLAAIEGRQN